MLRLIIPAVLTVHRKWIVLILCLSNRFTNSENVKAGTRICFALATARRETLKRSESAVFRNRMCFFHASKRENEEQKGKKT